MSPIQRTLVAIAAFVAMALGLFIWFIANWDSSKTEPIGKTDVDGATTASSFSVSKNPGVWGSAPVPQPDAAGQRS